MEKIKKFVDYKLPEWIGPVEILNAEDKNIYTNFGIFNNKSGSKITIGYSYILKVLDNDIIETGMSCVDIVILVDNGKNYEVLSIKRGKDPFKGMWANPGGNIDEGEIPIQAAIRELKEETGIKMSVENLIYVDKFDKEYRDPRNKTCISYAFVVILDRKPIAIAGDDAEECIWNYVDYDGNMKVDMAFDHNEIIKKTIKVIKNK